MGSSSKIGHKKVKQPQRCNMKVFSSIKQAYTQASELHTQRPNIKLRTLCILGCVQAYKLYKGV